MLMAAAILFLSAGLNVHSESDALHVSCLYVIVLLRKPIIQAISFPLAWAFARCASIVGERDKSIAIRKVSLDMIGFHEYPFLAWSDWSSRRCSSRLGLKPRN